MFRLLLPVEQHRTHWKFNEIFKKNLDKNIQGQSRELHSVTQFIKRNFYTFFTKKIVH